VLELIIYTTFIYDIEMKIMCMLEKCLSNKVLRFYQEDLIILRREIT